LFVNALFRISRTGTAWRDSPPDFGDWKNTHRRFYRRRNRLLVNALFRISRTGAAWRDSPPDFGDWKNTHRRFCRRRDRAVWEKPLEAPIVEPDHEWLTIDASFCRRRDSGVWERLLETLVDQPVNFAGERLPTPMGLRVVPRDDRRRQRRRRPCTLQGIPAGGLPPPEGLDAERHLAERHLAADGHGMPIGVIVTEGSGADREEARASIDGLSGEALWADRGYDGNEMMDKAVESGCRVVIPSKKNREARGDCDKELYTLCDARSGTPFFTPSDGAPWRPVRQSGVFLFLRPSQSAAFHRGPKQFDDPIRGSCRPF
jgi:transposase